MFGFLKKKKPVPPEEPVVTPLKYEIVRTSEVTVPTKKAGYPRVTSIVCKDLTNGEHKVFFEIIRSGNMRSYHAYVDSEGNKAPADIEPAYYQYCLAESRRKEAERHKEFLQTLRKHEEVTLSMQEVLEKWEAPSE